MKQPLKRYGPTLLTLLLIVLGAAMPWLTALAQDARIGKIQEELALNTVSLTLLENNGVEQVLRIASSEHVDIPWSGGTALTEQQARQAAEETLDGLYSFGLIQKKELQLLYKTGVTAEPCLLMAEDGSSALVWNCRWDAENMASCAVTVDDVSGKAVRIQTSISAETDDKAPMQIMGGLTIYGGTKSVEICWALMEMWASFLEHYYGSRLTTVTELEYFSDKGARFLLDLEFVTDDTVQTCSLPLEVYYNGIRFNF